MDERRLRELANRFLVELVAATGECAHAAVASGSWALVIDDVETDQPLRVVAGRGRRVPLHCTSAGKCLLAFELASVPHELPPRTARTITNPEMLRLHLAEIAERGYAVDDEENDPGVLCISAPVLNAVGEAIGCIGIDGPSVRITESKLDELVAHVVEGRSASPRRSASFSRLPRPPMTARPYRAGQRCCRATPWHGLSLRPTANTHFMPAPWLLSAVGSSASALSHLNLPVIDPVQEHAP